MFGNIRFISQLFKKKLVKEALVLTEISHNIPRPREMFGNIRLISQLFKKQLVKEALVLTEICREISDHPTSTESHR